MLALTYFLSIKISQTEVIRIKFTDISQKAALEMWTASWVSPLGEQMGKWAWRRAGGRGGQGHTGKRAGMGLLASASCHWQCEVGRGSVQVWKVVRPPVETLHKLPGREVRGQNRSNGQPQRRFMFTHI